MPSRRPPRRQSRRHPPAAERSWWRRHWKGTTAALSAIIVASASALIVDAVKDTTKTIVEGGRPPLAWTAQVNSPEDASCQSYVFSSGTQVTVPSPNQDRQTWATSQQGVNGGLATIRLTLQGRSTDSVVLHDLRVHVESRDSPQGVAYYADTGCGGGLVPRSFGVNLDDPKLKVVAHDGEDGPAVDFPYRISSTEPEVFLVHVSTETCDCRFSLRLDWTSKGREGTLRIGDGANPFRMIGTEQLPSYRVDMQEGKWVPMDA